jgi:peptidyl-prolyl cis-trans isomerase C
MPNVRFPFRAGAPATGFAAFALTLALLAGPAANPARGEDEIVAKVGAATITREELKLAAADLAEQYAQVPAEERDAAVLNQLIDIKLLARQAEAAGMADTPQFKLRLGFLRERTLHNAWFQEKALNLVKEEDVKARYDKEIAAIAPEQQVRASHILLKTKEEAEAVIAELAAGKDFAALAKERSADPGAADGGDLGFFSKGQMVPEFEAAAFAMKVGEVSKTPVQTQFGFHVIRKEEERASPPPAFEDVKDQVRQMVLRERYLALADEARKANAVEILDAKIKSQIDAAMGKN